MNKQISPKIISITAVILVAVFAFVFYILAWTEPSAIPPSANISSPINVGTTTQYKLGALGVGGVFQADSLTYTATSTYLAALGGKVGIGTTGPDRKLDVLDSGGNQLRLTYTDGTTYTDFGVNASGFLTINPSGTQVIIGANKGLVVGTNASDISGTNGMIYYNTTNNKFRCYKGGAWADCSTFGATVKGEVQSFGPGSSAVNVASGGWAMCPSGQYVCGATLSNASGHLTLLLRCCGD
ncbi:MAG: hypothetical protein ABII74_04265 [Elusimicrobiota bacterium]